MTSPPNKQPQALGRSYKIAVPQSRINNVRDYQFTAAAERALKAASGWTNGADHDLISPPELLLGLLAEAESRAAQMLAVRGVDTEAVLARWPQVVASAEGAITAELSPEVQDALSAASIELADFPRPLELATEHLLLGLVAARDELAAWLAERGFATETLADEICRLYGYQRNGDVDIDQPVGEPVEMAASVETATTLPSTAESARAWGGLPRPSPSDGEDGLGRPPHGRSEVPRDTTALYRLIDAAANRAREGLRVVEDFVRFAWDDRHLMTQLKELRHHLAAALSSLPADELLAARDTQADVGTAVSTVAEGNRPDLASVVTANFKRLQESLRSLEEYGKVADATMAQQIEQIRYRSYTLERAVSAISFGLRRLDDARLYVLLDGRTSLEVFTDLVHALVAARVDVLQLRDKQLADRELLVRARRLRELTRQTATLFIMNDRPDLAVLARADGVHVGQKELSVRDCRAIVGPRALIGVSTHSVEQARQAVLDGANYIGVGPTFASRTKRFSETALRGLDLLRSVHAEIRLPAFAIGGIDRDNVSEILATGFTRIAVSGAILSAADPGKATHEILRMLRGEALTIQATSGST